MLPLLGFVTIFIRVTKEPDVTTLLFRCFLCVFLASLLFNGAIALGPLLFVRWLMKRQLCCWQVEFAESTLARETAHATVFFLVGYLT